MAAHWNPPHHGPIDWAGGAVSPLQRNGDRWALLARHVPREPSRRRPAEAMAASRWAAMAASKSVHARAPQQSASWWARKLRTGQPLAPALAEALVGRPIASIPWVFNGAFWVIGINLVGTAGSWWL